eukprot:scaffold19289_cov145-Amphora_coffeaeformis.AAC.1
MNDERSSGEHSQKKAVLDIYTRARARKAVHSFGTHRHPHLEITGIVPLIWRSLYGMAEHKAHFQPFPTPSFTMADENPPPPMPLWLDANWK